MSELAATTPAAAIANREARVRDAVADASRKISVDFDYLLAQARIESSLDTGARARTSSAAGLFQFIESTWLATLHRHGHDLGLGDAASKIRMTAYGAQVFDPAARAEILAMRHDPEAASLMAGALAQDNRAALLPILGREPDASELYLAHFLGEGGAVQFLSRWLEDPGASAPALFPSPAAANKGIFFGSAGQPRSLGEVKELLEGKIARAMRTNGTEWPGTGMPATEPRIATLPTLPVGSRRSDWPSAASTYYDVAAQSLPARSRMVATPMSSILRESLDVRSRDAGGQPAARSTDHVRQAYAKLRALGL